MKYLLILLFSFSLPVSADFIQLTNTSGYNQSDYLMQVRYRQKPKVVMYSYTWCGYCKQARQYFRANRIPYVEYFIDRDHRAAARYKAFRGRVTPIIFAGRSRINGFSPRHFRRFYRW